MGEWYVVAGNPCAKVRFLVEFPKFKTSVQLLNLSISHQDHLQLLHSLQIVLFLVVASYVECGCALESRVLRAKVKGCDEGFLVYYCLIGSWKSES